MESLTTMTECEKVVGKATPKKIGRKRELEGEIRKKIDDLKMNDALTVRAKLEEFREENTNIKTQMSSYDEQLVCLKSENVSLSGQCEELQGAKNRLTTTCISLQEEAETMSKDGSRLISRMQKMELHQQYAEEATSKRISALNKELEEARSADVCLQKRIKESEERCSAHEETISRLEMQLDAALSSAVAVMPSVHDLKEKVKQSNYRLDSREEAIQKLEAQLEKALKEGEGVPIGRAVKDKLKESQALCSYQKYQIKTLQKQLEVVLSAMADDIHALKADFQDKEEPKPKYPPNRLPIFDSSPSLPFPEILSLHSENQVSVDTFSESTSESSDESFLDADAELDRALEPILTQASSIGTQDDIEDEEEKEDKANLYVSMDEIHIYFRTLADMNDSKTTALLSNIDARDDPSMTDSRAQGLERESVCRSFSSRVSTDSKESRNSKTSSLESESTYGGEKYVFAKPNQNETIDRILKEVKKIAPQWSNNIFRRKNQDSPEEMIDVTKGRLIQSTNTETDGIWC